MTSVYGDGVQGSQSITGPVDTKGFMFQLTTSPLMDDNIFVMNINETFFHTFRPIFSYLYTGFIPFSPRSNSLTNLTHDHQDN